jgi:hypothetical protein
VDVIDLLIGRLAGLLAGDGYQHRVHQVGDPTPGQVPLTSLPGRSELWVPPPWLRAQQPINYGLGGLTCSGGGRLW